jgi:undecaprenyl-phosphate 4-deoxy-4-formamido-L-arabinose transferase
VSRPVPDISVVIPVHNEEGNLEALHRRLDAVMRRLGRPYEIIYVDDGSQDRSAAILMEFRRQATDRIVVVRLYRNYGQFRAINAGFERVRGAIVVTLDADLQNPPEEIPRLIAKMEEGDYDIVNGWRRNRQDSRFRRVASRLANRMAAALTGVRMRDYGCMLRAYRIEVVRQVAACREQSPYIPTLANALARRATEIEVAHAARQSGQSNYSLWKLIHLQYDMVTSFSVQPLRWLSLLGFLVSGVSVLACAMLLLAPWFGLGARVTSGHALVALLFVLIGVVLLALGFVGEYVGRIYNEVRQRPRFVVRDVHEPAGAEATPDDPESPAARERATRLREIRDDGGSE